MEFAVAVKLQLESQFDGLPPFILIFNGRIAIIKL